jgi:hypothetical protein
MVVMHIQVRLLFLIYEPNDLFVYLRLKDRDQDFTFTYNSGAYIETKIVMLTTEFCSHLLTLMLADTYYHNQILYSCSARKRRDKTPIIITKFFLLVVLEREETITEILHL